MVKSLLISFFIFLTLSQNVNAQNCESATLKPELIVVDSILIKGNETTEDFVILRELTFGLSDTVDQQILDYNRERIYSLGIFNFVNISHHGKGEKQIIEIEVDETWYIYPIPFYSINNNKSRYGVRIVWKNFRGRDEKLSAMISFGYNPYYLFTYHNPLINEKYNLSLSVSSVYQQLGNPSKKMHSILGKDFEYKYISNYLAIAKRFDQFTYLGIAFGYSYVETPEEYRNNTTASGNKIDRYPFVWGYYTYDTRDLRQYAMEGEYLYLAYLYKGFGLENISHSIISVDYRKFLNLYEPISQKFRIALRHTSGCSVPRYDYSYLGYTEFVRGHKDDIREGDNSVLLSYELDLPIVKEWELKLDSPVLPTRLTSARIGVHLTAFADAATVFNNRSEIAKMKFDKGWGFGINLLFLPHSGLRFEYAFNEFGKGEFLIGTGLSF